MKHLIIIAVLVLVGCGDDTSKSSNNGNNTNNTNNVNNSNNVNNVNNTNNVNNSNNTNNVADVVATNISPRTGGFVSAVVFDDEGNAWLSGDDGSGLYRRDGAGWRLLTNAPKNWSTYAFAFDPNSDRVYAPNHFGRGMAWSDDGGETWTVQAYEDGYGLRWYGLVAVNNAGTTRLIASGEFGLRISDDNAVTFTQVTDAVLGPVQNFQALHIGPDGRIFAGNEQGAVFVSSDNGDSWQVVIPADPNMGIPVTDLSATTNALYVGYALGLVARTRTFDVGGVELLDTTGTFTSALWARVEAVSGADASQDTVMMGTVGPTASGFGLFISEDGGDSFSATMVQDSVFQIATTGQQTIITSVNGPISEGFIDQADWDDASEGVVAWDSLEVYQSPDDPDYMLFSSITGLAGNGRLFETSDGGENWRELASPAEVYAITEVNGSLIVGDYFNGIFRRSGQAWSQVLDISAGIRMIEKDPGNGQRLLAITSERAESQQGLYESTDGGDSWSRLAQLPSFALKVLPDGVAALGSSDVFFVGTDGMITASGLESQISGSFVTGLDTHPDDPTRMLAVSEAGFFSTEGCSVETAPCTWTEHDMPVVDALPLVQFDSEGVWYVSGAAFDTEPTKDSVTGLWRSTDAAQNWERIEGLYPCDLVWRLERGARPAEMLIGLWGGGIARIEGGS